MKLSFRYKCVKIGDSVSFRPIIPLILRKNENHISTSGILDSGSDFMLIPKEIAEYLGLELFGKEDAEGIEGKFETVRSVISATVSDGKNTVLLHNIPVRVLANSGLKETIIGREPFFSEFDVTFRENSRRVELARVKRG